MKNGLSDYTDGAQVSIIAILKENDSDFRIGAYPPISKTNVHYDLQSKMDNFNEILSFSWFGSDIDIEVPAYTFR